MTDIQENKRPRLVGIYEIHENDNDNLITEDDGNLELPEGEGDSDAEEG